MDRPRGDIWVFGYGSLMWRPNFPHLDVEPALLRGYHRALCIYSTRYRGTWERPGLVLGLDRGGSCLGRAFLVSDNDADEVLGYLHEREMVHRVYDPRWIPVETPKGRVTAYAFVAKRDHEKYVTGLSDDATVELILQGHGNMGTCIDYMRDLVRHMDELGIADGPLHRIVKRAEEQAERN